jgi:APA family basic amino acid/polyamine antiporter
MTSEPALRRHLGLWQLSIAGIGTILGAGIYALIGAAAAEGGSYTWLSFAVAALVAAFTALSYAELAAMFPSAGAGYAYALRAFGDDVGFVTGWLTITGSIVAAAAVALGFGGYLEVLGGPDRIAGALILIGAGILLAGSGVLGSVSVVAMLTAIEAAGLVLVTTIGFSDFDAGELTGGSPAPALFGGAALVFFAYIGFEDMATFAEETRDPERTMPRAILIALAVTTVLYMLVAVASLGAVGADALAASNAPLALVAERALNERTGDVLAWIALAATANTTIILLMAACRMVYSMARTGTLPPFLGAVHSRSGVPFRGLLAVAAPAALLVFWDDIGAVADTTNFVLFCAFGVVNAAVIRLRWQRPDLDRPFRTWGAIPFPRHALPLFPALAILTLAVMLVSLSPGSILGGAAILSLGLVLAYVFRGKRKVAG